MNIVLGEIGYPNGISEPEWISKDNQKCAYLTLYS